MSKLTKTPAPTPAPTLSKQFADLTAAFEDLSDLCLEGQSQKMPREERYALAVDVHEKIAAASLLAEAIVASLMPVEG